jgi:Protein of unknown function (DUF3667)
MTSCKNCGHQFDLDYCNKCGQKASVKRIEMKWLLHELPHAIWHIERGFFFNMIQLFKRPGYAVADYIEGKRKKFYHPISYLLILLAVMYLITHYLKAHWYDPAQDARMSEEQTAIWVEYDKSQQLWTNHYLQYMLIFMPVATAIFWVLLKLLGRKYNLAESFIVSLFLIAQNIIPQIILFFIAALVDRTSFTRTSDLIGLVLVFSLFTFQLYQLGNTGMSKTKRIAIGIIGAASLIAWLYVVLYIQTEWLN